MTSSIQEAYPIRQKGIHFVNPSSGFDALFKIFFSFMTDKIKKRVCEIFLLVFDVLTTLFCRFLYMSHSMFYISIFQRNYCQKSMEESVDQYKKLLVNIRNSKVKFSEN